MVVENPRPGSRPARTNLADMAQRTEDEVTRLALAAKAGDRSAAAGFIQLTQRDLLRFVSVLADRNDVEDIAQETYLRAMRALAAFDARSSARTWLFAIARRAAADQVRLARRRPRTTALDDFDEARRPSHTPRLDEAVAVRDLLRTLDAERREAFALTQMLGLSYEEAAQICGCPVGTIRSRVSRAREQLVAAMRADTQQQTAGYPRNARSRRTDQAG